MGISLNAIATIFFVPAVPVSSILLQPEEEVPTLTQTLPSHAFNTWGYALQWVQMDKHILCALGKRHTKNFNRPVGLTPRLAITLKNISKVRRGKTYSQLRTQVTRLQNAVDDKYFERGNNGMIRKTLQGDPLLKEGKSYSDYTREYARVLRAWRTILTNGNQALARNRITQEDVSKYRFSPAELQGLKSAMGGGQIGNFNHLQAVA